MVQTYTGHLIRSSLAFVSWTDRKQVMPDLKAIYRAENAEPALDRLAEFEDGRGATYLAVGQSWRRAWDHLVTLFAFPPDIRKMIHNTTTVESLNPDHGAADLNDDRKRSYRLLPPLRARMCDHHHAFIE